MAEFTKECKCTVSMTKIVYGEGTENNIREAIVFCPLHKSAPTMFKLLRRVLTNKYHSLNEYKEIQELAAKILGEIDK